MQNTLKVNRLVGLTILPLLHLAIIFLSILLAPVPRMRCPELPLVVLALLGMPFLVLDFVSHPARVALADALATLGATFCPRTNAPIEEIKVNTGVNTDKCLKIANEENAELKETIAVVNEENAELAAANKDLREGAAAADAWIMKNAQEQLALADRRGRAKEEEGIKEENTAELFEEMKQLRKKAVAAEAWMTSAQEQLAVAADLADKDFVALQKLRMSAVASDEWMKCAQDHLALVAGDYMEVEETRRIQSGEIRHLLQTNQALLDKVEVITTKNELLEDELATCKADFVVVEANI